MSVAYVLLTEVNLFVVDYVDIKIFYMLTEGILRRDICDSFIKLARR